MAAAVEEYGYMAGEIPLKVVIFSVLIAGCGYVEQTLDEDPSAPQAPVANTPDASVAWCAVGRPECQFPNATAACSEAGDCSLGPCDPGWYDNDDVPANGCEYPCARVARSESGDRCHNEVDDDCDGEVDNDDPGCGATPQPEICNDEDDDDDGEIDETGQALESDPRNCGQCGNICPPLPNVVPQCDEGVCRVQNLRCALGFEDANQDPADGCESRCPEHVELCNAIDDDCDGIVDEDAGLSECVAPDGSICGVGTQCVNGVQMCQESIELCNAVDDDCDGVVDENAFVEGQGECGNGACSGPFSCISGVIVCVPREPPADEIDASCNGIDDDCDTRIDEGFVSTTPCITDAPGARPDLVPDDALPAPRPGTCVQPSKCVDGEEQCPEPPALLDERCNGEDDDCDRLVDEGVEDERRACPDGACQGIERCDPGGLFCFAGERLNNDLTCDGRDDDCDGRAAENWSPRIDFGASGNDDDHDGDADEGEREATCGHGICAAPFTCSDREDGRAPDAGIGIARCQVNDHLVADDPPDAMGLDTNCDGIDGDVEVAVFVAPGGSGDVEELIPAEVLDPDQQAELASLVERVELRPAVRGRVFGSIPDAVRFIVGRADGRFRHVYVQVGLYALDEPIPLPPGVSIFGGYPVHWRGPRTEQSMVEVRSPEGVGLLAPSTGGPADLRDEERVRVRETLVERLDVHVPRVPITPATLFGARLVGAEHVVIRRSAFTVGDGVTVDVGSSDVGSSLGIYAFSSVGVTVERTRIRVGSGGEGPPGVTGAAGGNGNPGGAGQNAIQDDGGGGGWGPFGSCDSGGGQRVGGSGGTVVDCATGPEQAGGRGGDSSVGVVGPGFPGEPAGGYLGAPVISEPAALHQAICPNLPGAPGDGAQDGTSRPGSDACPGETGVDGANGPSAATVGQFTALGYRASIALDGSTGLPGRGGGGGGAGGGHGEDCNARGASGGGGGSAGCGGDGGTAGISGGASLGLVMVRCGQCGGSGNDIETATGGDGGAGGCYGLGGRGGAGGPGGGPYDSAGAGGTGGPGGDGGRGGRGGSGAGGPTVCLVIDESVEAPIPIIARCEQGQAGRAGQHLDCPDDVSVCSDLDPGECGQTAGCELVPEGAPACQPVRPRGCRERTLDLRSPTPDCE